MNLKPISKKQLLKNYAFNAILPFSVAKAATETDLKEKVVDNYLRKFKNDGVLTRTKIKGKYYYRFNHPSRNKAGPGFKPDHIHTIIGVIQGHKCESVRQISQLTGFSHQHVFSCMEAMASVEVVGFNGSYYIKDQSRITVIGMHLEKHILGRLKRSFKMNRIIKYQLIRSLKGIIKSKKRPLRQTICKF